MFSYRTKPEKPKAFSLFSCLKSDGDKKPMQFTNTGEMLPDNEEGITGKTRTGHRAPPSTAAPSSASHRNPTNDAAAKVHPVTTNERAAKKIVPVPKENSKKTELEQKILDTQHQHPSEKKDIFKSIFDDSDDNESDNEENPVEVLPQSLKSAINTFSNEMKSLKSLPSSNESVTSEALLPKKASEINILRNSSPPRGIFSNFLSKEGKNAKSTITRESDKSTEITDPDSYGPSLPPTFHRSSSTSIVNDAEHTKSSKSITSIETASGKVYDVLVEEKWVEKDEKKMKKKKSDDKHKDKIKKHKKKDKKEHKKDKHRDKRKKSKH